MEWVWCLRGIFISLTTHQPLLFFCTYPKINILQEMGKKKKNKEKWISPQTLMFIWFEVTHLLFLD